MAAELVQYRFTVTDCQPMTEAGIVHEDDWGELLDREIIEQPLIGPEHSAAEAPAA